MNGKPGHMHADPPRRDDLAQQVFARYPALARHADNYAVIQGRPMLPGDDRQLESYPPDESWNPVPGNATTELYNTAAPVGEQQQLVAGDMLHYLPRVDPTWATMKADVLASMTPEQEAVNRRAYDYARALRGDQRTFPQFMDQSRGDEFLMGYITPDAADQWRDFYTPEQRQKLALMVQYLSTGSMPKGAAK